MTGYRGGVQTKRGLTADEQGKEVASPQPPHPNVDPWYNMAREAAQIVVSSLALYASIRIFAEKIKKRRELQRRREV